MPTEIGRISRLIARQSSRHLRNTTDFMQDETALRRFQHSLRNWCHRPNPLCDGAEDVSHPRPFGHGEPRRFFSRRLRLAPNWRDCIIKGYVIERSRMYGLKDETTSRDRGTVRHRPGRVLLINQGEPYLMRSFHVTSVASIECVMYRSQFSRPLCWGLPRDINVSLT